MEPSWMGELETPCIVIDMETVRRNIGRMQREADVLSCRLRPHIKTHKMPLFARMQMEAGACGITCAKVSEAEVMAQGGLGDIFIAYPMVGDFRVRRAIALGRRVRRLILAADSLAGARRLSEMAVEAGVNLEVRLEVDTGAARTGVCIDEAVSLARAVHGLPGLTLTGIYTFKGLLYQGRATRDITQAAREEGDLMAEAARRMREAGVPIADISAGSTPTGLAVARTGAVNEIRPGTYIFNDEMQVAEGAADEADRAAFFHATVVSTPAPEYAVLDGGTKTFPTDVTPQTEPFQFPGYAVVPGREDLRLSRMNEEHGMLVSTRGDTGLSVGQVLRLSPLHVCTAINLQNQVYLLEEGTLRKETVTARGMLV